jgi:hypothetical protein
MLGTSSNYVIFTLRLPSFVHIFILKAIKKHSLLVVLSRIDSEASFFYHTTRERPDPATGRPSIPQGLGGGEPPKSQCFFIFSLF